MDRLLRRISTIFRETIESMEQSEFPVTCQLHHSFPGGACGDTSMLLGNFLLREYYIDSTYICGSSLIEGREQWTHAWLEYAGYKLDITADQFEEVNDKVIVCKSHVLYDFYEPISKKKLSECFPVELVGSYNIIMKQLNNIIIR